MPFQYSSSLWVLRAVLPASAPRDSLCCRVPGELLKRANFLPFSRFDRMPRWSYSTTSKCSITSGGATRRSARSVRPPSSDAWRRRAWTLPSLWTRKTRPQVTWKTAQHAVSHSAHTHYRFHERKKGRDSTNVTKPSTESDQAHGA